MRFYKKMCIEGVILLIYGSLPAVFNDNCRCKCKRNCNRSYDNQFARQQFDYSTMSITQSHSRG